MKNMFAKGNNMKNFELYESCFNLLNYVTISQNYLNCFSKDVKLSELKDYSCGHWGACPSVNFLYVHLIDFFKRHSLNANIVVGTGHAGSSVCANLWLTGEWQRKNKNFSISQAGLNNLISSFGREIRTEINPQYVSTIYDGGELGYSLAFAYGYAENKDLDFLPCIIGDGECETATLSASWVLGKLTNNKKVLPIINLNSLKMCSKTFLSTLSDSDLKNLFSAYGYNVYIVHPSHEELYSTLEQIYTKNELSLIIFKSDKGFTGLSSDKIKIPGELISHKNPLSNFSKEEKVEILNSWLKSYDISYFLNENKIKELIDFYSYSFFVAKEDSQKLTFTDYENASTFDNLQKNLLDLTKKDNLFILSPDEITSNKLSLLQGNKNLIEVLSENVLQGFYQGLARANLKGIFISYEAFMPIVISMVSQYLKYIYQLKQVEDVKLPSLNYILTSTAPENTYSHQNPEFVASLLNKEYKNVNVLYPANSISLTHALNKCFSTNSCINIITISKQRDKLVKLDALIEDYSILQGVDNADLILTTTGDYTLTQAYSIKELLKLILPEVKLGLVYISNLKILGKNYDEGLSDSEFEKVFPRNIPTFYTFMGYKSVLKNLLYERNGHFNLYGYQDGSNVTGCFENKFRHNKMGKLHIILDMLNALFEQGKISKKAFVKARLDIICILGKYY